MPVLRYFVWVGGCLLALLLVANFYVPKQPQRTEAYHTYNIPIAAAMPAGPQALNFSGETRDFGSPPPPMTVVDFSARPNDATQASTSMQANAQMSGAASPAARNAKPARQKVAKRKIKRQRDPVDRDVARLQDPWQRDQPMWQRDRPMGFAFARPFSW